MVGDHDFTKFTLMPSVTLFLIYLKKSVIRGNQVCEIFTFRHFKVMYMYSNIMYVQLTDDVCIIDFLVI